MKIDVSPKIVWFQNLSGGLNQSTDDRLIENNESPLLKNANLDKLGTWSVRKGTDLLGNVTAGSDQVYGLGAYNKSDGTHTFFRVCNRDLEKLTEGTATWASVDDDEWPASKKVNMVNFLDRLYLGSEDGGTALAYTTGTTITDVTPEIGGHHLAVNKSILAVGGNDMKPNIIFYSQPSTDIFYDATGTCGANADAGGANTVTTTAEIFEAYHEGAAYIYNTDTDQLAFITGFTDGDTVTTDTDTSAWDNDTIYVLIDYFVQDGECKGITSYQEKFISFDEDNMYLWDPSSTWSYKMPGFGCVNERTIQNVGGNLIWMDREAIYLYDGSNRPIDISKKIKDSVDGYGLFDLINASNFSQACAGSLNGKYYLSVGDLSTQSGAPASALTNAEFVFDVSTGAWTVNTRDDEPVVYATFINSSGNKDLYYGEETAMAVYKMNTGTSDEDSAGSSVTIAFEARSPNYTFADPTIEYRISAFYVKYKSGGDVTMAYSANGGSYSTIDTLSSSSTTTVVKVLPTVQCQGFTHSLKFACSSTVTIEAFGFMASPVSFGKVAT
jgi:hypothetical protein